MRFIFKLILHVAANALAIFIAAHFLEQIDFKGDLIDYLIVGAILTVANLIIRPILKIVSAPIIFITMGLFALVINAAILFAVDWFVDALIINALMGYVWGSLIISVVNAIIVGAYKKTKHEND
jgi:putative membrane protein